MPLLCLFFHVLMPDLEVPEHPPSQDRLVAACAVERVCKAPVNLEHQQNRSDGCEKEIIHRELIH